MDTTDTTTDEPEGASDPTLETRRHVLELLAVGDLDTVLDIARAEMPGTNPMAMVMQCVALEMIYTSATLEQETAPALKAVGAMTMGLFGGNQAEDADELLHDLNAAGKRHRAAFLGGATTEVAR